MIWIYGEGTKAAASTPIFRHSLRRFGSRTRQRRAFEMQLLLPRLEPLSDNRRSLLRESRSTPAARNDSKISKRSSTFSCRTSPIRCNPSSSRMPERGPAAGPALPVLISSKGRPRLYSARTVATRPRMPRDPRLQALTSRKSSWPECSRPRLCRCKPLLLCTVLLNLAHYSKLDTCNIV